METNTVTLPKKKTRADYYRDRVAIRIATNEAGPLIAAVLRENGIELQAADWTQISPHWLIATLDDDVIGCLQVMPAKPVAWVEFLYAKPSAPFKFRAIAIRKLIAAGMSTAYHGGAQYMAGVVNVKNRAFQDVLRKLNFSQVSENVVMAKLLVWH